MGRLLCIGDLNADITIAAESEVAPGSDTSGVVRLAAGGSAANVAAVAAAGVRSRFAGVVGDDLLGQMLTDELAGHGVEVRAVVRPGSSSRAIAALISPNGDRSMVSDLATATVLGVDDIDHRWFDGVDWLHLTAYTWFPHGGPEVMARVAAVASERGIPWSIDPSSAQMLRTRSVGAATEAFRGASVMFPNDDEATALTDIDDPVAGATRLLEIANTVVVTCGATGVVVAARDRPSFRAAAHDAPVVNTIGAGDAFAAGFIAARMTGGDDEASARAGLAAAARAVARATAR